MVDYSDSIDEQTFKMKYIKEELKPRYKKVFCIETEETVAGFPDVMAIDDTNRVTLLEFKFARGNRIKFKPTQPGFYKRNSDLSIWIVAYNKNKNEVHIFEAEEMFTEGKYKMNERAEVKL